LKEGKITKIMERETSEKKTFHAGKLKLHLANRVLLSTSKNDALRVDTEGRKKGNRGVGDTNNIPCRKTVWGLLGSDSRE